MWLIMVQWCLGIGSHKKHEEKNTNIKIPLVVNENQFF